MRHVFEPVAGRCRRLRACALAGALHGRAAARGGTGIDRAILAGRVRFHDGLCVLDRRGRFEAARRYLSSLNL
jgi:hypothetical protein